MGTDSTLMPVRGPGAPDDHGSIVRVVVVIMGVVVGLTFLFGFGDVLDLALRLGVPVWVAPLVVPAVDLSILGLLLGTRHLVLHGVGLDALTSARRLLILSGVVTLSCRRAPTAIPRTGRRTRP